MKKVTIRDVAKEAGVSIATISRALSGKGKVSPETQAVIEKAIRKTGYLQPPATALNRDVPSGIFYLVVRNLKTNSYSEQLNNHMIQTACQNGLRVLTVDIESREGFGVFPNTEIMNLIQEAAQNRAVGIIISGFSDLKMTQETKDLIRKYAMPIVFINRNMIPNSFNRILTGSDRGAYIATQYLIDQGRKGLLMVQPPYQSGKTNGFIQAVKENEGKAFEYMVRISDGIRQEDIDKVVREAFQENPAIDGIVCCEDEMAAYVLQTLHSLGKKVKDEVDVIGYNDNLAQYLNPPISSVRVPLDEICKNAIEMLTDPVLQSPDTTAKMILLDPQLIVRN